MNNIDTANIMSITFFWMDNGVGISPVVLTGLDIEPQVIMVCDSDIPSDMHDTLRLVGITKLEDILNSSTFVDLPSPVLFTKAAREKILNSSENRIEWSELEETKESILRMLREVDSRKWGNQPSSILKAVH